MEPQVVVAILSVAVVVVVGPSLASGDTWRGYVRTPAKVYWRYYDDKMSWENAQRRCAQDGAYLAIADTNQKIHMLKRKLNYDAWIGLQRDGSQFKWIDGRRATNGNWLAGEPNGGGCVFTRRVTPSRSNRDDGKWLEETCAARKGFVCESKNGCVQRNPCLNGGKCGGVDRSISCSCTLGFQGENCERDKRPCIAFNPCKNNARCANNGLDYSCNCPSGLQGKNCELDKRPCLGFNPCKNGARCTNRGLDYSCACPAGFGGKNCEEDKRPCVAFNPCKNGGRCNPVGAGGYSCSCKGGFRGDNCEKSCPLVMKGGFPEKLDLVFLVDGSKSVQPGPFSQGLKFINQIVGQMDISPSRGRVGFVQFAHKIIESDVIGFRRSTELGKANLEKAILHTKHMGGGTEIGKALNQAILMFNTEGRSGDVAKYIMVLSDGESKNKASITTAMKAISAARIKTFVVAVGGVAQQEESRRQLKEIAQGNENHIFSVDNYNQLNDEILKKILVSQCD